MVPKSNEERLARIEQKLDDMIDSFNKISNGVGFPRCAERVNRILTLEKNMKWLQTTVVGVVIIASIKFLLAI